MEIKARLTLLVSEDGARIEIEDSISNITFFRGEISSKDFCSALGRLVRVPFKKSNVILSDNIGKEMEISKVMFPIGECGYGKERKSKAIELEKNFIPDGWESDSYYGSQDSFPVIDGVQHARVTIRRWV